MKLKLLNNLPSIDSDFSDFEKDTIYSIHFDPKQNTKTLVQASKYSATFKFKSHNKWLCVKLLNEEYVTNGMYVDTFENEFSIGFELNHPNIIQYYKLVKTVDTVYILKEYVDGLLLKDYLLQFTSTTTFFSALHAILLQLIDVLHYLHSKQIYHLDVKPANILITSKGHNVKLIDFGLSTRDNHDYYPAGTENYSSPEQRKSTRIIDGRSDIYALGKTLDTLISLPKRKRILYFLYWIKFKWLIKKCISESQANRFHRTTDIARYLKRFSLVKYTIIFLCCMAVSVYFVTKSAKDKVEPPIATQLHMHTEKTHKPGVNGNLKFNKKLQNKHPIFVDARTKNVQNDSTLQLKNNSSKAEEPILSYLRLNDIDLLGVQTPNLSCLTAEDKLFCEKLLDTLHINFIHQLAAKPENIDSSLLVFKYKNQLNTYARRQLIEYNYSRYNNDKTKTLALREYFDILKKQEFQRIKKEF